MPRRLLAFDPGLVTGWSYWSFGPAQAMLREDYGLIRGGAEGVIDFCITHHRYLRESVVVCERFVPEKLGVELTVPIRIEGALMATCASFAVPPPEFQLRSRKRNVGDATLRRAGLWLKGSDPKIDWTDARDVNDSQLHALAWAKDGEHEPTLRAYWGEDSWDE